MGFRASLSVLIVVSLYLPGVAQTTGEEGATSSATPSDYVIGVEDRLTISVWREEGMTRTLSVRPDGKITFDLVGDVQAAGRTPRELDEEITTALAQVIRDPVVTVIVEEINSFKVFMIGEFASPGEQILRRRTRFLEAIALAGGLTAYADKSNVQVMREEGGKETRLRIDYKKVLSGDRPDLNIFLKPGDTIIAN